jgi:hypothetical protein
MPVYTTTLPNGQSVRVMGPANATPETIQQAALQIAAQRAPVSAPDTGERNYSLGTAASKAFSRGTEQIKSSFGDVIPAMVGNALGFDEFAERQIQEAEASQELINRKYRAELQSYKDVKGIGDALKFGIETVGEQLPNLGTMVGAGGIAGLGARVGTRKLAADALAKQGRAGVLAQQQAARTLAQRQATAQGVGTYMGAYSLNAPEIFQNIYQETGELTTGTALLYGAVAASLDSVLPNAILKNITPIEKAAIAKVLLKKSGTRPGLAESVFKGFTKGAGSEALTEGAQEALSISAENFVAGNSQIFDGEDWERIMESSVRGAVAGGTFRGVSEPFGRQPAERPEPITPPPATEGQGDLVDGADAANIQIAMEAKKAAEEPAKIEADIVKEEVKVEADIVKEEVKVVNEEVKAQEAIIDASAAEEAAALESDRLAGLNEEERAGFRGTLDALDQMIFDVETGQFEGEENVLENVDAAVGTEVDRSGFGVPVGAADSVTGGTPGDVGGQVGIDSDVVPAVGVGEGVSDPALETVIEGAPVETTAEPTTEEMKADYYAKKDVEPATVEAATIPQDLVKDYKYLKVISEDPKLVVESNRIGASLVERMKGFLETIKQPATEENLAKLQARLDTEPVQESRADTEGVVPTFEGKEIPQSLIDTYIQSERAQDRAENADAPQSKSAATRLFWKTEEAMEDFLGLTEKQDNLERADSDKIRALDKAIRNVLNGEPVGHDYFSPENFINTVNYKIDRSLIDKARKDNFLLQSRRRSYLETKDVKPIQESRADTKGTGQTTETVTAELVQEFGPNVIRMIESGKLVIVNSVDQLPANIKMSSTANGAYAPKTQTSYIVANRSQKGQARRILLHEIGEHYGLERMVGKDYISLLNRLKTLRKQNAEVQAIFDEVQRLYPELTVDSTPFLQEVMAKLGERAPNNSLFRRIVGAVKNFLRRLGLYDVNKFSDADIQDMILNSLRVSLAEATSTSTRGQASNTAAVQMSKEVDNEFKPLVGWSKTRQNMFFNSPAFNNENAWDSSYGMYFVTMMSPQQFLDLAAPISTKELDAKIDRSFNTEKGKSGLKDKLLKWDSELSRKSAADGLGSQPFLSIRDSKIVGHEGRHRARALQRLGIKPEVSQDIQFSREEPPGGFNPTQYSKNFAMAESVMKKMPVGSADYMEGLWNKITQLPTTVRRVWMGMLGLQAMSDLYGKYLPSIKTLINVLERRAATVEATRAEVDVLGNLGMAIIDPKGKERKRIKYNEKTGAIELDKNGDIAFTEETTDRKYTPAELERWEQTTYELSRDNIDPRNPDNRDDPLVKRFFKLPAELQALSIAYTTKYEQYGDQLIKAFVKNVGTDPKAKEEADRVVIEFKKNRLNFYHPFRRKGDYVLSYVPEKELQRHYKALENIENMEAGLTAANQKVSAEKKALLRAKEYKRHAVATQTLRFETKAEYLKALEEVESGAEEMTILKSGIYPESRTGDPGSSAAVGVMDDVLKVLTKKDADGNDKIDAGTVEQVRGLFLDLLPSQSIKQQTRKRIGTAGYIEDVVGGFIDLGARMATQIANLEYIPEIDKTISSIKEESNAAQLPGGAIESNQELSTKQKTALKESLGYAAEELSGPKARSFFHNPVAGNISSRFAYLSYLTSIAGNVSSALVNATQLAIIVYPSLVAEYGFSIANKAMADAFKLYFSGGKDNNRGFLPDVSFGMKDGKPRKDLSPELQKLYDAGLKNSVFRRGVGYELTEMRKTNAKDFTGTKAKFDALMGWMFQNTERMNREVTYISGYLAATEKAKQDGGSMSFEQAEAKSRELTRRTHGTSLPEIGPRFFQTGFGKVAFTFKRYGHSMMHLLIKGFNDAYRGETKEVRAIARKQLLGVYGASFAFAGLQGVPLYGFTQALSEAMYAMFGDDDEPYDFEESTRDIFGDIGYRGPLNKLLNLDIASRTGFANLIWREDPRRISEVGLLQYVAEQGLGPAFSYGLSVNRGLQDMGQGNLYRGLEQMAPAFVRNPLKGFRYATEGALNRKGAEIVPLNPYDGFMQIFGFTNEDLSLQYARNQSMKQAEKSYNARRSGLLTMAYLARKNGDTDLAKEVQEKIDKFNRSTLGSTSPILGDTLNKSFKTRERSIDESVGGINLNQKVENVIRKEMGS